MKHWLKNMAMMLLLLLAGRVAAQAPVLDSVCSGAVRNYAVVGDPGSTYTWIITPPALPPITLPSDADTVQVDWTYPAGVYELQSVQHALNGCDADAVYGLIYVFDAPDVYAGPDAQICLGRTLKLLNSDEANTVSLLWITSGDGTFDDNTLLHAEYNPGAGDILAGTVTLTLTGYGVLQDEEACAPSVSSLTLSIVDEIIPQFEPIGPLCINSVPPALPDTSLEGITGIWIPPVINTSVAGTFTYTFTPDNPDQCGVQTTMDITIATEIIPEFEPIGPLCINSIPPPLPDTSLNGITGTWNPPTIDTSIPGIFVCTFTPDPGQCGAVTDLYIVIATEITPLFDSIGPLCQFSIPPVLPNTSLNGITGTWEPGVIDTSTPGAFTFDFTPDPDQCGTDTSLLITILPLVTPQFDEIGPLCQYSQAPPLPGVSLNGITGTWDPAWINTSVPGIFTFTFTPDTDQCATVVTMDIVILPEIVPDFEDIGPLCVNSVPPILPDTSLNGVPGTWDPPVINTGLPGTFFFTFTPSGNNPCILPVSIAVIVTEEITPQFAPIGPLCQFDMPPALPDTSLEGFTGTWAPPFIATDIPGTFTFAFTADTGQCAGDTSIYITIIERVTPEFESIGPLCQYSPAMTLPGTSLNGISGTWDPPVVTTDVPGTFSFTFTPDDPGQCASDTTIAVTVLPEIFPLFDPVGPLCQFSPPVTLPDTSLNGITGSWNPPVVTTDVPGTFSFTFTPDDQGQCASDDTMDITVIPQVVPTFDQIGPLCLNSVPPGLPLISVNGITGSWDPPMINTTVAGTFLFTFTPDNPDQCAADTSMQIIIGDEIMPEFDQAGPYCQLSEPETLPLISLNGIAGTWEPPVISTLVPGNFTFIFTPDAGQCAVNDTMVIVVEPNVTPLFNQIGPLSQNSVAPMLPVISLNGISGTWDPPFIDTSVPGTYSYEFTPDPGECAVPTDMDITVLFDYLQAISGAGGHCLTGAAIVPLEVDNFTSVAKFQLKLSYNVDKLLCEGYINPHPQLAANLIPVNDQLNGIITISWEDTNPVTFPGLEKVCDLVFTPKEPGQGQLTWYTGPTDSYFYDLDGQMIPAEFYAQDLQIYEPPEIILGTYKNICIGDTVMIYGTATTTYPPLTYQWTLPDGTVQSADPYLVNVVSTDGGDYVLLVTDSLGCTDQKSIHIIVNDNPIADFHDTDTLIVQPGYILEAGSDMASYLWNTGETGESIVIDSTGLYWVNLVSAVGCIGTDSVYVILSDEIPEGCMLIPNAFTPDGDGLNDSFKAYANCPGITYFRMYIFNRWGQMIYETDDISAGWDGRMNGNPVPGDVYVYKIVYRITGIGVQEEFVKKGNVLLLK